VAATGGHPTTPIMQSSPKGDLDLPLRALACEDATGVAVVGYTAPADLVARYQIGDRAEVVQKMTGSWTRLLPRPPNPER
jgi:uncharacterized protein (DUF302 family)